MSSSGSNYDPSDGSSNSKSVTNDTGETDIYFGGDRYADDRRHGHIRVNEAGEVLYVRDADIRPSRR